MFTWKTSGLNKKPQGILSVINGTDIVFTTIKLSQTSIMTTEKRDLIDEELKAWSKTLNPFPSYDDLEIIFFKRSKYLSGFWNEFEKRFDRLYAVIEDPKLSKIDREMSRNILMKEMFNWIVQYLKLHFYTIYSNVKTKRKAIPWLDEKGEKKYSKDGKVIKISVVDKKIKLKDYVVQQSSITTIVSEFFTFPNLLIAIIKHDKELLKEEIAKARRHVLTEDDPQMKRYIKIIEKWIHVEKIAKPTLKKIVDAVEKEEKYAYKGNLYDAFRQWRKNNPDVYHYYLEKLRKESNN